jgi:hypothetical protein
MVGLTYSSRLKTLKKHAVPALHYSLNKPLISHGKQEQAAVQLV